MHCLVAGLAGVAGSGNATGRVRFALLSVWGVWALLGRFLERHLMFGAKGDL